MNNLFKLKVFNASDPDSSSSDVHFVPLNIGIILIIIGVVDALVFFFIIPFNKIQDNKKKYPNQVFGSPKLLIIIIHFLLHIVIIALGVILILISLNFNFEYEFMWILGPIIVIIIIWIIQMIIGFKLTSYTKSEILTDQFISNLKKENPSNLAFIYTSDSYTKRVCSSSKKSKKCHTETFYCYSNFGYKIPIKSQFISNSYDFSKNPDIFYLTIIQRINMTETLKNLTSRALNRLKQCDDNHNFIIEYHPIITGDFILSYKKLPKYLSKETRMISIIFGVGVFYELYSNSIPSITLVQNFNADLIGSIYTFYADLQRLSCQQYGRCSSNRKPTP